jgi:hypothetical protein
LDGPGEAEVRYAGLLVSVVLAEEDRDELLAEVLIEVFTSESLGSMDSTE